jgi:hypothetical protein
VHANNSAFTTSDKMQHASIVRGEIRRHIVAEIEELSRQNELLMPKDGDVDDESDEDSEATVDQSSPIEKRIEKMSQRPSFRSTDRDIDI